MVFFTSLSSFRGDEQYCGRTLFHAAYQYVPRAWHSAGGRSYVLCIAGAKALAVRLTAGYILGYDARYLPVGAMARIELELLVGVLQRDVVADLSFGRTLIQIGDPISAVLCLYGRL